MRCFPLVLLYAFFFATTGALLAQSFETPERTLETYLKACEEGDFDAAQACYTKSSRELSEAQEPQSGPADPET